jgi:hypothetical protein
MVSSIKANFKSACRTKKKTRNKTVPMILKLICTAATRFAFLLTPMLERRAVTQVPIFCHDNRQRHPHMLNRCQGESLQDATEAEELWMIP